MKHIIRSVKWPLLFVVTIMLTTAACVAAEFSATRVFRIDYPSDVAAGGKAPGIETALFRGRVFFKGDMVRTEFRNMSQPVVIVGKAPTWKATTITITLHSKKLQWILDPSRKVYVETRVSSELEPTSQSGWKLDGYEMVKGYRCKKYTKTENNPGVGQVSGVVWWSEDLKYPIKSVTTGANGSIATTELSNIVMKKLPASLFQLPAGYKKVRSGKGNSQAPTDGVILGP